MLVNGRAFFNFLFMEKFSSNIRQIVRKIGYASKLSDGLQKESVEKNIDAVEYPLITSSRMNH